MVRCLIVCLACAAGVSVAQAQSVPDSAVQNWAIHGQATVVEQFHPGFHAGQSGPNSLDSGRRGDETAGVVLSAGLRLWHGAEFWLSPEVDQGFGLSNTEGVAGFPSAAAYKVGQSVPYIRLQRIFMRQTIDLGGGAQSIDAQSMQLRGVTTANRMVITVGRYAVTDIFDTNPYAHDPTSDFLNWTMVDGGAFDYAANAWGYTYGASAEWYRSWWTLRGGVFDGSQAPNSKYSSFPLGRQFQFITEAEARYRLFGQQGTVKALFFVTHAQLASFADLNAFARANPDQSPPRGFLRAPHAKYGGEINLAQPLDDNLGVFLRASLSDGRTETDDFTDVDRSLELGVSGSGVPWHRDDDRWGAGFVVNMIDHARKDYYAAGGLGLLVGDGSLPNAGPEQIFETWYSVPLPLGCRLAADYQLINHPAYNTDRGPVHVFGSRFTASF